MKSREDTAEFINIQLRRECWRHEDKTISGMDKGVQHHYGKQELRELLDFIYESQPEDKGEMI